MCVCAKLIFACVLALAFAAPNCPLQCPVVRNNVCASDGTTHILFYNECEFHSYLECEIPANRYDWKIEKQEICSVSGTNRLHPLSSPQLLVMLVLLIKYNNYLRFHELISRR